MSNTLKSFRTRTRAFLSRGRISMRRKPKVKASAPKTSSSLGKRPMLLHFPIQEQMLFTKRLGMILRSGTPIMEGLHMLNDEAKTGSSKYIYGTLVADVTNGQPLSSGMAKFERVFGAFCINIVRVGETSGTLHENLEHIAGEMKKKQALRGKVVGALVYPAVIVAATVGITVMLMVVIFPKIMPIFQSVKMQLPISTRILIVLSTFLTNWGIVLFFGLVAFAVGFAFLLRVERFHYWADVVLMRIPIFGKLSKYYNLANICRTMSVLLKSDVRIVQAIELVANSTKNLVYKEELMAARERLIKGQKISTQFKQNSRLFPSMLAQMVTVGEATGNLGSTLTYLSDMYEEDISDLTRNLTTLLEPILMVVMGIIVGFIAISIISPIYGITQALSPH